MERSWLVAVAAAAAVEAVLASREFDHFGRMDQKGRHVPDSARPGLCYLPAALVVIHLLAQAQPHQAEMDRADS